LAVISNNLNFFTFKFKIIDKFQLNIISVLYSFQNFESHFYLFMQYSLYKKLKNNHKKDIGFLTNGNLWQEKEKIKMGNY